MEYIVSEGSAGGINPLLDPGDVVVPHDFIDMTKRPSNIHHFTNNIPRMNDPLCPDLRNLLVQAAREVYANQNNRVFSRGVYGNTGAASFRNSFGGSDAADNGRRSRLPTPLPSKPTCPARSVLAMPVPTSSATLLRA